MSENRMSMYTIYHRPADFPDRDVLVVHWDVTSEGVTRVGVVPTHDLPLVRVREEFIAAGLIRVDRQPDDDPTIVETWF